MFSAMNLAKLYTMDGGWPGRKVDRKPKIATSMNSSLLYPSMNDRRQSTLFHLESQMYQMED